MRYPYKLRCAFTYGQRAALQQMLSDPAYRPRTPGGEPVDVETVTGLIRYLVQEGIIATGMPLGPIEIDGDTTIGPVPPERDTVQHRRRELRDTAPARDTAPTEEAPARKAPARDTASRRPLKTKGGPA